MLYGAFAVADHLTIGLVIQPQLFALFTLINIAQCYYYGYKWSIRFTVICGMLLSIAYAGLHIGIYFALKKPLDNGNTKAESAMGILPAVFIALGFFPEYYICIKEKSVEMSNFFLALDISGGVFSTLSLAFDHTFNYVASIMYLIVVLLDLILLFMKYYYKWRNRQNKLLDQERGDESCSPSARSFQDNVASPGPTETLACPIPDIRKDSISGENIPNL
ncbi:hypothetical protein H4219_000294 [Mycoemilia scoparia]|uniref:Uncharacterized protein n=1 Tax=Mycoemilia scoparia TaxID=417184 RepID=A0A9W8AB44_9FUNG|nr:hypothetical protein H4219_000294 [Mycoemilia scoparia]